jgi:hypothetical protein
MEPEDRDSTQDWLLPKNRRPPALDQLEGRIDEALAVARSAESAAITVGAAALDAAQQAREAAEVAQRSAELVDRATSATSAMADRRRATSLADLPEDKRMRSFSERADRVAARLRALERLPA